MVKIVPGVAHDIIMEYLPNGWTVTHPRAYAGTKGGKCNVNRRHIYCHRIEDEYTLRVFLHEVCHAILHPCHQPLHMEEYMCERYAHREMRKLGFQVTRDVLRNSKLNVLTHINPNTKVPRHVRRWVKTVRPQKDT